MIHETYNDQIRVYTLFDLGITTLEQLGKYPVESLQQHFGPNNGLMMSEMSRGIDHTEIPYIDEVQDARSIGHTYTLPKNTKNKDNIYGHLLRLAEKVGRRLRKDEYQARYIWAYLRWGDMSGRQEGVTLKHYVNDGYEVYTIARSIINSWYWPQPVRLVGVGTSLLLKDGAQLPMIEYKVQQDALLQAQDSINNRYGEFTIQRARSMNTRLIGKVGGFKEPHQFH